MSQEDNTKDKTKEVNKNKEFSSDRNNKIENQEVVNNLPESSGDTKRKMTQDESCEFMRAPSNEDPVSLDLEIDNRTTNKKGEKNKESGKVTHITESDLSEQALFHGQCKLYRFDQKTKAFVERGEGIIYILPTPGGKMDRILMIRDGVKRFGCNHYIDPSRELRKHNAKYSYIWRTDTDTCEADALLLPKQCFVARFMSELKGDEFSKQFEASRDKNSKISKNEAIL